MNLKTETTALLSTETALATALTFDDVLLVPQHSDVVPTQVDVTTRLTRNIRLSVPLVSAAMDTVTESRLAIAMAQQGGLGVIHKNLSIEEQASEVDRHKGEKLLVVDRDFRLKGLITVKDIQKAVKYPNASKDSLGRLRCGAAVGIARDTIDRADALVAANVDVLVVDTAHGHSQTVLDMVRQLRRRFPGVDLVAGNVATADGAEALIQLDVDAVKVGIGAGSICTTRIIAGIGVPMITAVMECARAANAHDIPIIADGGIRFSGD